MNTRPNPVEVGQRLRLLRFALGHRKQTSMVAFLRRPTVTVQHWNNWERGRSFPPIHMARLIAMKALVTVDWLYWGERGGLPLNTVELLDRTEVPPTTRS
jgi:transcriptional regulator with XRE-family HTH domain